MGSLNKFIIAGILLEGTPRSKYFPTRMLISKSTARRTNKYRSPWGVAPGEISSESITSPA